MTAYQVCPKCYREAVDGQRCAVDGALPVEFNAVIHSRAPGKSSFEIGDYGQAVNRQGVRLLTQQAPVQDETYPMVWWIQGRKYRVQYTDTLVTCTCPHGLNHNPPVCKHTAAVALAVQISQNLPGSDAEF